MHAYTLVSTLSLLAGAFAAPVNEVKRAASTSCPSYTIINTRGTGEPQGPSAGFRTMNSRVTTAHSGGKIYNTVYLAGFDQNSAAGTADIVNKIASTLRTNPSECFILEGYSQGAQATVNALPKLTGASFDAVKGVFLIGDPAHKSGLTSNVDNNGGTTTRNVNGLSARLGTGIPENWIAKTLDVCIFVSLSSSSRLSSYGKKKKALTSICRVTAYATLHMDKASTHSTSSTLVMRQLRNLVAISSRSSWLRETCKIRCSYSFDSPACSAFMSSIISLDQRFRVRKGMSYPRALLLSDIGLAVRRLG
jgi:hypothetical protein